MISHAKISRHHRMFKTPTGLSTEGFKQILPFHHRRSGAPHPASQNPERQRQFYFIIDGVERPIQRPKNPERQRQFY